MATNSADWESQNLWISSWFDGFPHVPVTLECLARFFLSIRERFSMNMLQTSFPLFSMFSKFKPVRKLEIFDSTSYWIVMPFFLWFFVFEVEIFSYVKVEHSILGISWTGLDVENMVNEEELSWAFYGSFGLQHRIVGRKSYNTLVSYNTLDNHIIN